MPIIVEVGRDETYAGGRVNTLAEHRWPTATKEHTCPKCGKANRCRIAPDGNAGICWRSGTSEAWHDSSSNGNGKYHHADDPKPSRPKPTYVSAEAAIEAAGKWIDGGNLAATFIYPGDAARVARFNLADGSKEFRPVHRVGNGWMIGDPPGKWPMYRGDELPAAGPIYVFVVEGEQCCDISRSIGLAAVTSAHGSNAANKTDWTPLAGREIVILPDADAAGEKYAADVAAICDALGCKVKIVRLPGLPPGGDIEQFDAEIAGTPEQTRDAITALADAAMAWRPTESTPEQSHDEPAFTPVSLRELSRIYHELREPMIDGLLRRGQVGNLVSTSKAYKTFLMLMLAICMAMRKLWLDCFPTAGGKVLILDLELQQPDIVRRVAEIMRAMHAPPEIADAIDVLSFRGRDGSIDNIEKMLLAMQPRSYSLVILDPLYKTYPAQFDENSNAQMTALYRRFERIAEHLDCALMIVHHATKGGQSEKRVVDVGAGAGSQSRSADCHVALREHETEGCVIFDAKVRSFRPPDPLVLRFNYPLWERDLALDPTALKSGKASRNADKPQPQPKEKPAPWTVEKFAGMFITAEPQRRTLIEARARQAEIKNRDVAALIEMALAEKKAFRWNFPKDNAAYIAKVEQPVILSGVKHE
jgi:hypothetical protein